MKRGIWSIRKKILLNAIDVIFQLVELSFYPISKDLLEVPCFVEV